MSATEQLAKAKGLLAAGDISGLLRFLRSHHEALPLGEIARLVAEAAALDGLSDLAQAAAAVAAVGDGSRAEDAQALYCFGYLCVERNVSYLAVRPLTRMLELLPATTAGPLGELVTALEIEGQHARAVAVLEEHEPLMQMDWQLRYFYVYNAIMAGDLRTATERFEQLPEPDDTAWIPAREKVRHMLARARTARPVTPLDNLDLRGWHYVLTGGLLVNRSPYGFGYMTGRWGFLADSAMQCAAAVRRVELILDAAAYAPKAVMMLPDRSSRIIGTTAAAMLGLPVTAFDPERPDTLVVAYDLTSTDRDAVRALRWRAPGQILFERVTRWPDPPHVTADITGLLCELIVAPWDGSVYGRPDGTVGQDPPDERPVDVVAAEIGSISSSDDDDGDGTAPPDPDHVLRGLAEAAAAGSTRAGGWLGGIREYIPNSGPVPSARLLSAY